MKAIFKIPKALSCKGDERSWNKFKQNFDIYMNATGLVNYESENKVNIFLNIAGDEALEIYNNLKLTPDEKKDFDRVIGAFEEYVSSKQNLIYKSFKFFTRVQQPGEFFIDFYNDLQVMADYCQFGDQKDRLIRDRIIAANRNPDLLGVFLKAPDLSLEEVVNKCVEDEVVRLNNGHCKIETGDEAVNEQEIVDEESNNNYEDMLNNRANIEEEFTLDQMHVPDEILFNDMAAEEVVGEANIEEGEKDVDIDIEENNVEDLMGSVDADVGQNQNTDVKPLSIERSNLRNRKTNINDINMLGITSIKKEKLIHRKNKAEVIQMKIAEIKEKLSKDIKKEVGREQMGIFQKITRSRVKQFLVKNEPQTENFGKQKQEENEGDTFVRNLYQDIEDEEEDPYSCEDDPNYEIDNEELPSVQEHKKVQEQILKNVIDNVDSQAVNEMVEAEYLAERETTNRKSASTSTTTKSTKKRIKWKGKRKNKEVKIIELKRDNLPPLILTTVKNKTLLIGKMPYPCKKCDSSFWTSMQLERHQLVHVLKKVAPSNSNAPKKVFKCEVCLKEFRKICDLERHTRVHTGEKPSVCNICNKRFQQAYNLHKHLLTHTQEKNYECVICQKRFGRSDVLNRHVLTHSIDKPYHCSICLKTFIRNSQLKLHLRKHHDMSAEEADVAAAEKEADSTPPVTAQEEECSATPATFQAEEPVAGTSSELTEHTQVCAF